MSEHLLAVLEVLTLCVTLAAASVAVFLWIKRHQPNAPGFHWIVPLFGNELHIKHRRMPRFVEDKEEVPVLWLGRTIISFWSRQTIVREARYTD